MRNFMKKYIAPICPLYAIIPLISCFVLNCAVYWGCNLITFSWYHHDFTTDFDRSIPFIPWFVSIYLVCYVFWVINYIIIGRLDREHLFKFVVADMSSRIICCIFFILMPTTNIRPEITGTGIFDVLMRFLYNIDSPTNLFPSIHCLVSWFCYIGIRGKKEIPVWYRVFSCVFAIMVCISTQVTKQHYIIDLIAGIALAEITWAVSNRINLYKLFEMFFNRISGFVFGRENIEVHIEE